MRRRDAQASSEAILQATLGLLGDSGLHALTTEGIAARARCAKGLVNYHFPTRVELLRTAVRTGSESILRPRIAAMAGRGVAIVDPSWQVLLDQAKNGTIVMWCGVESLGVDPRVRGSVAEAKRGIAREWERAIRQWLARSGFTESSGGDLARATWALLAGFGMSLIGEDPDALFPAYLTAWLGLIADLERAST